MFDKLLLANNHKASLYGYTSQQRLLYYMYSYISFLGKFAYYFRFYDFNKSFF